MWLGFGIQISTRAMQILLMNFFQLMLKYEITLRSHGVLFYFWRSRRTEAFSYTCTPLSKQESNSFGKLISSPLYYMCLLFTVIAWCFGKEGSYVMQQQNNHLTTLCISWFVTSKWMLIDLFLLLTARLIIARLVCYIGRKWDVSVCAE